jgi:hypothetical protein
MVVTNKRGSFVLLFLFFFFAFGAVPFMDLVLKMNIGKSERWLACEIFQGF